jgi:hypothetical protein
LSKSTVSYHARRLGFEPDARFSRRYDWQAIRSYYEVGHTVTECRERFGFDMSSGPTHSGAETSSPLRRGSGSRRTRGVGGRSGEHHSSAFFWTRA